MNAPPSPARAPRIDAHQHYWSLAHGDYGWLTPAPGLRPIFRDFGPADLQPHLDAAGMDGSVLVQAAPSEAETWRLLALAHRTGSRVFGVVGWCDLAAPDAARRIERLAAEPLLKGLRPMLQDLPDPRWVLGDALVPAFRAMVMHGLALDLLVKPPQREVVLEFVLRHPELRCVVDHGAKPAIAAGEFEPWATQMTRLARQTDVACKLSGLLTEAAPATPARQAAALRPYVDHLLAEFGPGRLLWGSDWPVLHLAGDYAGWHDTACALLSGLGEAQRDMVFGTNARDFYRLALV